MPNDILPNDRSGYRNVLFSDARYPDDLLGGLRLNPSVTQANFLHMLEILIISSSPYDVSLRGTSTTLTRCNEPLQPGTYDIKLQSAQGKCTYFFWVLLRMYTRITNPNLHRWTEDYRWALHYSSTFSHSIWTRRCIPKGSPTKRQEMRYFGYFKLCKEEIAGWVGSFSSCSYLPSGCGKLLHTQ